MDNVSDGSGRLTGPQVRDLLLRYPNVIAWVNGHTHRNQVLPHARPAGSAVGGGFWEINTAAHIDWPHVFATTIAALVRGLSTGVQAAP